MFDWLNTLRDKEGLQRIRERFRKMLADGQHVFDHGSAAVLGGADPSQVREDVFRTDQGINRTEQEIRRDLLLHGVTHGANEIPTLLMLMSLVKDAERIGDYGKNMLDLARAKGAIVGEERQQLLELRERVLALLGRMDGLLDSQDEEAGKAFLQDEEVLRRDCEALVARWLTVDGRNLAAAALACRYMKRVAGHAGNVITSIVMPLDKLDFHPWGTEDDG